MLYFFLYFIFVGWDNLFLTRIVIFANIEFYGIYKIYFFLYQYNKKQILNYFLNKIEEIILYIFFEDIYYILYQSDFVYYIIIFFLFYFFLIKLLIRDRFKKHNLYKF